MVSLKIKMKKKPSFKILGKKAKKEEYKEENTNTITVEPTLVTVDPTPERTPVENDPIMEDREDKEEAAAPIEEERYPMSDERSIDDAAEDLAEDESVLTEANAADDKLSTVKEEPSKEEAEEKASQESAPTAKAQEEAHIHSSMEEKDTAPSMDDTATLDATDTTINLATGCPSPRYTPGFCGCFGI